MLQFQNDEEASIITCLTFNPPGPSPVGFKTSVRVTDIIS